MTENLCVKLTKHARRRIGQRGITNRFLNALLTHANTEVSVGGGVVALSVTPSRAQNLNIDDKLHRYTALRQSRRSPSGADARCRADGVLDP